MNEVTNSFLIEPSPVECGVTQAGAIAMHGHRRRDSVILYKIRERSR